MIGVILPSRGLIFAETEISIEKELKRYLYRVYRSSNLKIPDGHNQLTQKALDEKCDYIFYIEEDMVIPDGGFERMINLDKDIVFIDYAVNGWSCSQRKENEILWCGLGCTLIKSYVFKSLDYPYFRTDKVLRLNDWKWVDAGPKKRYGGQDIWFFSQAREVGFEITQAEGECRHLKLDELGNSDYNDGFHKISDKEKITKIQRL